MLCPSPPPPSSLLSFVSPADITVVDADSAGAGKSGPCGVLVVSQGREHEFSFSTDEGCLDLTKSSGFERLIFVSLGRGHKFKVRITLVCSKTMLAPVSISSVDKNFVAIVSSFDSH
jgi:hypothetical protein